MISPDRKEEDEKRLQQIERVLLLLFLIAHIAHFGRDPGQASGFDSGDFLFRVGQAVRGDLNPPLRANFWAYHPPLAFLLARFAQFLPSVDDVIGIRLIAKLSFLGGFLAMRAVLADIGLLRTAAGIAFLSLFSALPLMVHASASLNMDMLVLALASLALLCAVRLRKTPWFAAPLLLTLTAALFVKFSGLLIGIPPLLVAGTAAGTVRERSRRLLVTGGLIACSLLLASPYYYTRYYVPTGSFFPNVNEWWYPNELRAARETRDADRLAFVGSLFLPSDAISTDTANVRDMAHARLADSWGDLWRKDPVLGPTTPAAIVLGRLYGWLFALLIPLGLLSLFRRDVSEPWRDLGRVLLPFGLLQVLALIAFIFQQPLADMIPGKCLYILPVSWAIAYAVASLLPTRPGAISPAAYAAFGLIGLFQLLNTLLPVY